MQILWRFGCGLFLLTSIHIIITNMNSKCVCVCVSLTGTSPWQKTPTLLFYAPCPLLVHSPLPPGPQASSGGDNCVMVCSLSGSGQATGVFSQSRHLLCSAAVFSSDVMSCGRSRPCNPVGLVVQERAGGWAVIRACGGGDWIRGLYLGTEKNNAASWKLVSVPCKNVTFTVNFTLSVSDLEDAWK